MSKSFRVSVFGLGSLNLLVKFRNIVGVSGGTL